MSGLLASLATILLALIGAGLVSAQERDYEIFLPPSEWREWVPGPRMSAAASSSTIDILFAYTPGARAMRGAGTPAEIQAVCADAVDWANQAFINSAMNVSLNLVGVVEVAQEGSGSPATDLNKLVYNNDGVWDEIHLLRTQYNADAVSLITSGFNTDTCGRASLMFESSSWYASLAFSVLSGTCDLSSVFAHEFGHNLGGAHDRDNAGDAAQYQHPDQFGHRFTGLSNVLYRTIMAYAPGIRIQHFSNPLVQYDGVATGIAGSTDNARVMQLNAPLVAANLPVVIPTIGPVDPSPVPTSEPTIEPTPAIDPTPTLSLKISLRLKGKRTLLGRLFTDGGGPVASRLVTLYLQTKGKKKFQARSKSSATGNFSFTVRKAGVRYLVKSGRVWSKTVLVGGALRNRISGSFLFPVSNHLQAAKGLFSLRPLA